MGGLINATWEERLARMAKMWCERVGKPEEDILAALQTNPQCVNDVISLLGNEAHDPVDLFNNYSNMRRHYKPDLPRHQKTVSETRRPRQDKQGKGVVNLPEFDDAMRIITHYRTLVDRHAHLMDEVHKLEEEMKIYRPIAEGYETIRRKVDEVKENIAKRGPVQQ